MPPARKLGRNIAAQHWAIGALVHSSDAKRKRCCCRHPHCNSNLPPCMLALHCFKPPAPHGQPCSSACSLNMSNGSTLSCTQCGTNLQWCWCLRHWSRHAARHSDAQRIITTQRIITMRDACAATAPRPLGREHRLPRIYCPSELTLPVFQTRRHRRGGSAQCMFPHPRPLRWHRYPAAKYRAGPVARHTRPLTMAGAGKRQSGGRGARPAASEGRQRPRRRPTRPAASAPRSRPRPPGRGPH